MYLVYHIDTNAYRLDKDMVNRETVLDCISFDVLNASSMYIFYMNTRMCSMMYAPQEDPVSELADIISRIEQSG